MKVLIACEFSGRVRTAFAELGHDAWSCDTRETETPGQHIQCDVTTILDQKWDLMIAHPPCTYLAYSGLRWFKTQPARMDLAAKAFDFFMMLVNAPIPMIAIENPRGFPCKWYRPQDQIIEPYYFGDPVTKATYLWLKNLPPLLATNIISNPEINWTENTNKHDARNRSRTFKGIAAAMAAQWSIDSSSKLSASALSDLISRKAKAAHDIT